VFELLGGLGRLNPSNCFLNPLNTLSNHIDSVYLLLDRFVLSVSGEKLKTENNSDN